MKNSEKNRVIQYLSKTYLKDAEKLGYTLDDLINIKKGERSLKK